MITLLAIIGVVVPVIAFCVMSVDEKKGEIWFALIGFFSSVGAFVCSVVYLLSL